MKVALLPDAVLEHYSEPEPLVLIVEDSTKETHPVRDILQTAGYCTQLAQDGSDALRLAREMHPSLVVTDIQLVGMDGLTLARELKSVPETASIPVVAVSSEGSEEERLEALASGCCGFITRPFRYRTFLTEVTNALQ